MKVSMMTGLLSRVHYQCAVCKEIKLLEYLVVDDEQDMHNICRSCRDAILEKLPLNRVGTRPLWMSQEENRFFARRHNGSDSLPGRQAILIYGGAAVVAYNGM